MSRPGHPQLIVALDYHQEDAAFALINQLDPAQCCLKVGSEMFTLFGPSFVKKRVDLKFRVFLDLKFHDIPTTVARACVAAADLGVWMLNVHASGGLAMMEAAKQALDNQGNQRPLLIAVTILTSMHQTDLAPLGITASVEAHAAHLAVLAKQAGLDGVVCSAFEVPIIKGLCGDDFIAVTPGVRLNITEANDQARVATVKQACDLGSNYLVVGRPITLSIKPSSVIHDIQNMLI